MCQFNLSSKAFYIIRHVCTEQNKLLKLVRKHAANLFPFKFCYCIFPFYIFVLHFLSIIKTGCQHFSKCLSFIQHQIKLSNRQLLIPIKKHTAAIFLIFSIYVICLFYFFSILAELSVNICFL